MVVLSFDIVSNAASIKVMKYVVDWLLLLSLIAMFFYRNTVETIPQGQNKVFVKREQVSNTIKIPYISDVQI